MLREKDNEWDEVFGPPVRRGERNGIKTLPASDFNQPMPVSRLPVSSVPPPGGQTTQAYKQNEAAYVAAVGSRQSELPGFVPPPQQSYVTIGQQRKNASSADKEEADPKAKEEADRKAKEEADHKAKEEADRKAKEEADRTAKEEADFLLEILSTTTCLK